MKEEQDEKVESTRKAGSLSARRMDKNSKSNKKSSTKNEFSIEDLDIYARSIVWLKKKDKLNEEEQVNKKIKSI